VYCLGLLVLASQLLPSVCACACLRDVTEVGGNSSSFRVRVRVTGTGTGKLARDDASAVPVPGLTLGTLYSSGVGVNKTKQHVYTGNPPGAPPGPC